MSLYGDTPLYDELQTKKENGETLKLEDITYNMMKELWWKESLPDSVLADLFDVEKKDIKNYRYKLNIKQHEMIAYDMVMEFKRMMDKNGMEIRYKS